MTEGQGVEIIGLLNDVQALLFVQAGATLALFVAVLLTYLGRR